MFWLLDSFRSFTNVKWIWQYLGLLHRHASRMIGTVIPRIIVQFLSTHCSRNLGVVEHSGGHQDPQEKCGYMQKQKSSHDTKQPGSGPCLQSGAEGRVHFGQVVVIVVIGAGG